MFAAGRDLPGGGHLFVRPAAEDGQGAGGFLYLVNPERGGFVGGWEFATVEMAVAACNNWDPAARSEPMGWTRRLSPEAMAAAAAVPARPPAVTRRSVEAPAAAFPELPPPHCVMVVNGRKYLLEACDMDRAEVDRLLREESPGQGKAQPWVGFIDRAEINGAEIRRECSVPAESLPSLARHMLEQAQERAVKRFTEAMHRESNRSRGDQPAAPR